jgi:hypothetical protein
LEVFGWISETHPVIYPLAESGVLPAPQTLPEMMKTANRSPFLTNDVSAALLRRPTLTADRKRSAEEEVLLQQVWRTDSIPSRLRTFVEGLSKHIQVQFGDYQNLILRPQINAVPWRADERFAVNTGKIDAWPKLRTPEFWRKTGIGNCFSGGNKKMNARPQVREILIARKLQRWSLMARHKFIEPSFPRARARKNYQRLFYRYRELAEKIGLHEWSAF